MAKNFVLDVDYVEERISDSFLIDYNCYLFYCNNIKQTAFWMCCCLLFYLSPYLLTNIIIIFDYSFFHSVCYSPFFSYHTNIFFPHVYKQCNYFLEILISLIASISFNNCQSKHTEHEIGITS